MIGNLLQLLSRKKERRNVTLDTSVLIAWIVSKNEEGLAKKVVFKAANEDHLMITDIIYDEVLKYGDKRKAKASKEEISEKMNSIESSVISISPMPSDEELMEKYRIRDKNDLKILYSVEMTNSVILVTYDDDFFDNVEGIKARILHPSEYLRDDKKGIKRCFGRR